MSVFREDFVIESDKEKLLDDTDEWLISKDGDRLDNDDDDESID